MADYTRKTFEIVPWNRKVQKANENLTPEAVRQLAEHETSIAPHIYEEFRTPLSCEYKHIAYYYTETVRQQRENQQANETEDQQLDQQLRKIIQKLKSTKSNRRHL